MSVFLYHKALHLKLSQVFSNIILASEDQVIRRASDTQVKQVPKLPIMGLWCTKWGLDPNQNHSMAFRGTTPHQKSVDEALNQFKRMPITLNYSLTIFSTKFEEVSYLTSEMLWFIKDFPQLAFKVIKPFEIIFEEASLVYEDVNDNFELSSFFTDGVLYRTTIDFSVINAYLFNVVKLPKLVKEIEIEII